MFSTTVWLWFFGRFVLGRFVCASQKQTEGKGQTNRTNIVVMTLKGQRVITSFSRDCSFEIDKLFPDTVVLKYTNYFQRL